MNYVARIHHSFFTYLFPRIESTPVGEAHTGKKGGDVLFFIYRIGAELPGHKVVAIAGSILTSFLHKQEMLWWFPSFVAAFPVP